MPENLLTTKLYVPLPRSGLVSRKRLMERLGSGLDKKLVLISAPAGFGKTTLLGEWVANIRKPHAWLSLDESDNDPARFLAYLVAALQKIDAHIGDQMSSMLQSSQSPLSEATLVSLINLIAQIPKDFVLILDDYQSIQAQSVHAALSFILEHLPLQMHLVIATRIDPPVPIARLRAGDQLAELRLPELRFSLSEATAFLNQAEDLALTSEEMLALAYRTEGWVAGLQMAVIALQSRKSRMDASPWVREGIAEFIQDFTGSNRYIMDYLGEEVLQYLPEDLQKFLLRTSILDRMTGSLCEYIIGLDQDASRSGAGGQEILEFLDRSNLFVVPMDDGRLWYRYHRLFADLLRKRLYQEQPDLIPGLHRRASEWFEQQAYLPSAIDHAITSGDLERAACLVDDVAETTMMLSQVETLQNWIAVLPDELLKARPNLRMYQACAMLLSGHSMEGVEACLQDLDEGDDLVAGRLAALRSFLAFYQGKISVAAELARRAMGKLPESDFFLQNIAFWNQTLSPLESDDFGAMMQALEDVAQMGHRVGNVIITVGAMLTKGRLQKMFGRLDEAAHTYHQALEMATDDKGCLLPIAGPILGGLGELSRERNDLDVAAKHLEQGIALAGPIRIFLIDVHLSLMMVKMAWRDIEAAQKVIWEAKRLISEIDFYRADSLNVDAYQARLWIEQGNLAACERWAGERGLSIRSVLEELDDSRDASAYARRGERRWAEYTTLARMFIALGESDDALALLDRLIIRAQRLGLMDRVIDAQALSALALQTIGDTPRAILALEQALSLAEPQGYARVFVDEGKPMADLLSLYNSLEPPSKYVEKLLSAFDLPVTGTPGMTPMADALSLAERLSERELEVLRLLRTNLSAQEIAEELFIAVSTVRSHIKSIYRKLGVHRRREAINRAGELGIL